MASSTNETNVHTAGGNQEATALDANSTHGIGGQAPDIDVTMAEATVSGTEQVTTSGTEQATAAGGNSAEETGNQAPSNDAIIADAADAAVEEATIADTGAEPTTITGSHSADGTGNQPSEDQATAGNQEPTANADSANADSAQDDGAQPPLAPADDPNMSWCSRDKTWKDLRAFSNGKNGHVAKTCDDCRRADNRREWKPVPHPLDGFGRTIRLLRNVPAEGPKYRRPTDNKTHVTRALKRKRDDTDEGNGPQGGVAA